MASDNSAKPILVAGAVGTVALLGVAWMFAASSGKQAVINAAEYAESRALPAEAESGEAAVETAGAEEPAEVEVAEAEPEKEAEPEVAGAEPKEEAEAEVAEAEAEEPAETEVAEAEPEKEAEPEVAEAQPEEEAEVEVAEAEEPAETEVAEAEPAEAEKPAETETAEAEPEKEAEPVAAEAEAEEPAETEVAAAVPEEAPADVAPAATVVAAVTGDAKKGAKVFRKCKACHKIGEGAKNAVGPQLTNVVGRAIGSVEGFGYSDVFKAANADGRVWTPEELAGFLTKPKDYMPKTKMAFGGLRKEKDRDDVIAYLATNGE